MLSLRAISVLTLVGHDRAIKMNLANEGLEARKKEEEVVAKKRKAEEEAKWEGQLFDCWRILHHLTHYTENRDQRVDSWRSFANASKKKKKAKITVLG